MRAPSLLPLITVGFACSSAAPRAPAPPDEASAQDVALTPESQADDATVTWPQLQAEIEAVICTQTLEPPGRDPVRVPRYGRRDYCGLEPAATPIERSVVAGFASANEVLISLRAERDAAFEAVAEPEPEPGTRLAAVRRAYLSDAFLGVLLVRMDAALAEEGLHCQGCPTPVRPPRREVTWEEFEPYLLAHVWPDPVVTPTDDKGRPTGDLKLHVHICGGLNGVSELAEPDSKLIQAGYLAAIHTSAVHTRVGVFLGEFKKDEGLEALTTDEARTNHMRQAIAPYLLADPAVRTGVCATLARLQPDTGIVVTACDHPQP